MSFIHSKSTRLSFDTLCQSNSKMCCYSLNDVSKMNLIKQRGSQILFLKCVSCINFIVLGTTAIVTFIAMIS